MVAWASLKSPTVRQLKGLLAALFCLMGADGLITRFLVQSGMARESNPLIKGIAGQDVFPFIKVLGAGIVILLLWRVYGRRPAAASLAAVSAVVMYTCIVYWNVFAYVLSQAYAW